MGIADRDYMRRDDREPYDQSGEERVSGKIMVFLRKNPKLPAVIIGILAAVFIVTIVALMLQ